ncbi:hypothetical protein [Achromobacter aloeverae]|uniref:Uncharacterized protein n=1 Tax=Achromobacter aloeverae TaxID=1750518 RepID=A0A4Q1HCN7_9BURK|nr:hypothetical protein [Achromobacter aloeverae]RXN83323.1 hypothetical protein C7R54_27990 [Achromobacter aloeverae]
MAAQHRKPDNPDVLGTDPIVPGMMPDPLPEDPDVYPADKENPPPKEDVDEQKAKNIGPIDLA